MWRRRPPHEVLNLVIPLIRNLDPGTKLSWHINRDGREEIFSIPRPSDRDLGSVSDLEQRVIERQSGSPGYYSSLVVPAPTPISRPADGTNTSATTSMPTCPPYLLVV